MSIGREPGTGMPNDWASSGCRLPVVVQCDFKQQESDSGGRKNVVVPLTGEVRFPVAILQARWDVAAPTSVVSSSL